MLSPTEGARGARAPTQSAPLLRESEAAPTVSPIVTVHTEARPQACRSSENTVQQIMVRVGVGPTPMLAMRKLIIPAGHRALGVWCASAQAQRRGAGARGGAAAWYLWSSYAQWVGRVGGKRLDGGHRGLGRIMSVTEASEG